MEPQGAAGVAAEEVALAVAGEVTGADHHGVVPRRADPLALDVQVAADVLHEGRVVAVVEPGGVRGAGAGRLLAGPDRRRAVVAVGQGAVLGEVVVRFGAEVLCLAVERRGARADDELVEFIATAEVRGFGEPAATDRLEPVLHAVAVAGEQVAQAITVAVIRAGDHVVRVPAGADLDAGLERGGGTAGPLVEPQLAAQRTGEDVAEAVAVHVAGPDQLVVYPPAGADLDPRVEGFADASGAGVQPQVSGVVAGQQVGVAVPGDVAGGHDAVVDLPAAARPEGCRRAREAGLVEREHAVEGEREQFGLAGAADVAHRQQVLERGAWVGVGLVDRVFAPGRDRRQVDGRGLVVLHDDHVADAVAVDVVPRLGGGQRRRPRGAAGQDDARVLAIAARCGLGDRIRRRVGQRPGGGGVGYAGLWGGAARGGGQGADGQGQYPAGGQCAQSSAVR